MHFVTWLNDGPTVDLAMNALGYTLAFAALIYLPVRLALMVFDRRQIQRKTKLRST